MLLEKEAVLNTITGLLNYNCIEENSQVWKFAEQLIETIEEASKSAVEPQVSQNELASGAVAERFADVEWEYEDQLPETINNNYNLMYRHSKIIDGVRMFPYTKIGDIRYYLQ